ncbi:MAG: hypothetical protein ACFB2X_26310 [Rivularia sp. (in: cyanobacteria)]
MKEESSTDKELRELVQQIQQLAPNDRERQKLLNQLIKKIKQTKKLKKFISYYNLPDFQDVYADALGDCLTYISKKIDKYNPKYPVMAWVNQILKCSFSKVFKKRYRKQIQSVILDEFQLTNISAASHKEEDICILVREFIQNDPEGILKNIKMEKYNVSLQNILLMILHEKKWKEIAEELQRKIPTIQSFYRRSLGKPEIKEYFDKYLN